MTSKKKVAANRINGNKSHGPRNTTSTRFSASKHGLLATGITELDDAEGYSALLNNLLEEKVPVGVVETFLVESLALDLLRLRRARRFEAEYITGELNPPTAQPGPLDLPALSEPTILDPGLPPAIGFESGQRLVTVFQRYESTFVFRILRLLHELERLQRMRSGERLPAPSVVDLSVHTAASSLPEALEKSAGTGMENSTPPVLEQAKSLAGGVDLDVTDAGGTHDTVPEALERTKAIPRDQE